MYESTLMLYFYGQVAEHLFLFQEVPGSFVDTHWFKKYNRNSGRKLNFGKDVPERTGTIY